MIEEPEVIYEDKDFLAVIKPAGLLVHAARGARAAPGKPKATLANWLLKKYPEIALVGDDPEFRPGIVHRLDKGTSGVMLVARNQKYFEYLKSLFQERGIQKTYLAVVLGSPAKKKGTVNAPIGIRNGTTKRSIRSEKMAKSAITDYRVLKTFDDYSLLEVSPRTGRTHQIRVHLASIGCPVAGDRLYGPKKQPLWATRLMLHALALEFTAARGTRVKFEADSPF